MLYMSLNRFAVLHCIFSLLNSNFCGAGYKIRRLLNPPSIDTEVNLLGSVCCILKIKIKAQPN